MTPLQTDMDTSASAIPARLARLRESLVAHQLAAYVVPSPDPHQSEYVPEVWQRRQWISGFTGSRGTAVVTPEQALLWTDSRYWLQAEQQLEGTGYALMRQGRPEVPQVLDWLETGITEGGRVGLDPRVITQKEWRTWHAALEQRGVELVLLEENLVDALRAPLPNPPAGPVRCLPLRFSGRSHLDKLTQLREELAGASCEAHVITTLDSVCWLLNLRGADTEYNPVCVSYAIVTRSTALLFLEARRLDQSARDHLGEAVELRPYESFGAALRELGSQGVRVWVDATSASRQVVEELTAAGANVYEKASPILVARACKNEVELAGMRACHVRDGVAMVRFLHWLEGQLAAGVELDEVEAGAQLLAFRQQGELFQGPSFATISAHGPNAAIVHYIPTPGDCRTLRPDNLYLLDSGGHYLDGTTDITRTVALGEPSAQQQDHFTRVLQGHVALARAQFPEGVTGGQLDSLARQPLWNAGLTYGHGTGHGVGHYLCVHEGPVSIAPTSTAERLRPGMVLSNEPGYYRAGSHGIRIENLVEVVQLEPGPDGDGFLGFRELTLCPIDRRLIRRELLSAEEREWLDAYHARVRESLLPCLTEEAVREWLVRATEPLGS